MKAKSIKGTPPKKFNRHCRIAWLIKPTLAIAFLAIYQDRATCKILDDAGIAAFGATTNGGFWTKR